MNELNVVADQKVAPNSLVWNVEIADLGAHRPFHGFSLTDQYMLVGITSPNNENLVSINTIPEKNVHQFSIPLDLERHQLPIAGEIHFKGIDKLAAKWSIYLFDRRSNESMEVDSYSPISIKSIHLNNHEQVNWAGFKRNQKSRQPFFELHLTRK